MWPKTKNRFSLYSKIPPTFRGLPDPSLDTCMDIYGKKVVSSHTIIILHLRALKHIYGSIILIVLELRKNMCIVFYSSLHLQSCDWFLLQFSVLSSGNLIPLTHPNYTYPCLSLFKVCIQYLAFLFRLWPLTRC